MKEISHRRTPPASRVLLLSNPLNHEGGIVAFCRLLLDTLDRKDIELVHHSIGSRAGHFYATWLRHSLYPFYYAADLVRLRARLLRDPAIRLVHVNPSLIPLPLIRDGLIVSIARRQGRRTIVFLHGWKEPVFTALKHPFWRRWFSSSMNQVDAVVVLAERFKSALVELGVTPDRITVLSTMFHGAELLEPADRRGCPPRLIYVGRISPLKGCGEILEAVKRLRDQGRQFELWMVGHGDRTGFLDSAKQFVSEHHLESSVKFLGRLDGQAKFKAYSDSDIYVFPSWMEGCPTTVLEALGSGLFVVGSPVGAMPEILHDNEPDGNGRFVRERDAAHLTEELAWALDNLEAIRSRRAAIRANAFSRFEAQVVTARLEEVYRRVLGLASSAPRPPQP